MFYRTGIRLLTVSLAVASSLVAGAVRAEKRPPANVPPSLEIEVLDPGVDPLGNPAVRVEHTPDGVAEVDIPPVILVHRYYYSGDRSFQGPMLPGGPSIVVLNHPQTGERCYIPLQMMPGAPRVTYTKHGIEYDYRTNAITIAFGGWTGKPTIKYRNGKTWTQKAAAIVHAEELKDCVSRMSDSCSEKCGQSKMVVKGAFVEVGDVAKTAAMPVRATLEVLPFGKRIFSGDTGERLSQRAAEHDREHAIRKTSRLSERNDADFPTNR